MLTRYYKYLLNIFLISTIFVSAHCSLLPDESLQADKGIILLDEKNDPIDLVYLPINLKQHVPLLRSYCEQESSISQSLQDFVQALADDFNSIPKQTAQQAINEIAELLSHHTDD